MHAQRDASEYGGGRAIGVRHRFVVGGEGGGPDGSGTGSGSGGGFGLAAKPAGVYVIDGSNVSWRPAVDVNRIVLGGQIVAVMALLVLRSILRTER